MNANGSVVCRQVDGATASSLPAVFEEPVDPGVCSILRRQHGHVQQLGVVQLPAGVPTGQAAAQLRRPLELQGVL